MVSKAINISLPEELLQEIDEVAAQEHRTRSELLREGARRYIGDRQRWQRLQAIGAERAQALGLQSEADLEALLDSLPE